MEAFGIFEGGGVRGIGLVGALEVAMNNYEYSFIGVAGTSAGAIVAALYATQWPIDEIKSAVYEKDFESFLDGFSFQQAKGGVKEFIDITTGISGNPFKKLSCLSRLIFSSENLKAVTTRIAQRYGVFDGKEFVVWLDKNLNRYLKVNQVTFETLRIPLKIVASNLNTQEAVIFSKDTTPEMLVADAVRASISIPFFFIPCSHGSALLVDGGLMSNFPAWVFDNERKKIPITIPTIGFRLIEEENSNQIDDISTFGKAVLSTGIGGYKWLQTRGIENLIEIAIPTRKVNFLKFDLDNQEKDMLLDSGRAAAHSVLQQAAHPKPPEMIVLQLKAACSEIKGISGNEKHVRANVFLPSGSGKVKIFYQFNMNSDPDRELEFDMSAGVTGRCWEQKKPQIVDLAEVSKEAERDPMYLSREWKFRPQEHAAVRKSLKSLLSIPIFDPRHYDPANNTGTLIGVLNFDSDNTIEEIGFNNPIVFKVARQFAEVIANLLK